MIPFNLKFNSIQESLVIKSKVMLGSDNQDEEEGWD
jgi:hypothetical protein